MNGLLPLVAGAVYGAWTGWRSNASYTAVPCITAGPGAPPATWPRVSVIIPARDEAHNLPRLLASLCPRGRRRSGPDGPPYEVLVVDDASSDATGEVAAAFGARVVRLEEGDRPEGWTGKTNACWRGAGAADGDWLLFLDADTDVAPAALAETLHYAIVHRLDTLSILLQQRCETFWERLLLPFAYQQLFAGIGAEGLTGARPEEAAAAGAMLNGQFILIRAGVYRAIQGHGAVRDSIVEDVALGHVLATQGYRIATRRGEHLGSVRMYRDLASIREGFGKNAFAFLAGRPGRGLKVALSSACAGAAFPLLGHAAGRVGLSRLAALAAGVLAWAALASGLAGWVARYGVPSWYALGQPLAATVFNAIAVESSLRSLTGTAVRWKGRRYVVPGRRPKPGHPPGAGVPVAERLSPRPRLPRDEVLSLGLAIAGHERHSLRRASDACVRALAGRWEAAGTEHIPAYGPVCFVANHWQRSGLWIGWGVALIDFLVARVRPGADPPVHWLVLTELRLRFLGREWHLAPVDAVLRRVGEAWGMVALALSPGTAGRRAGALRTLHRLATGSRGQEWPAGGAPAGAAGGRAIGFFPEGHQGQAGALGQPVPGTGRLLDWLARSGVAVVPVAIYETQGRLGARFGAPITTAIAGKGEAAAAAAMTALAGLLPPPYGGPWGPLGPQSSLSPSDTDTNTDTNTDANDDANADAGSVADAT